MTTLPHDQDHTVTVHSGDKVHLDDIPSTGYGWQLSELPPGWLVTADEWGPSLLDDDEDSELVGGSATRVFGFTATAAAVPGRATIVRRRVWEDEPPLATVTLDFMI